MNAQTAQVVPFQNKEEWNFDMKEVIKHVDPQGNGSPSEHKYFFELCKAQNFNPLIKEVYFIKYGSNPAAVVINVDTFVSRANQYPDYDGYTAGWTVGTESDPKDCHAPFGKLLGAWCKVGRKEKKYDVVATVRFDAFDTGKSRWKIDPWGMIQKCAIAAAHRKAYPTAFKGIYEWSEMDQAKEGTAKNVTPPKPAPKPKNKIPQFSESDLETLYKHHPDAVVGADKTIIDVGEENPYIEEMEEQIKDLSNKVHAKTVNQKPKPTIELDPENETTGKELIVQIANDIDLLLAPDNNPNSEPVFDDESYARVKGYIEQNFSSWKQNLNDEEFKVVQATIKDIRGQFPPEVVEEKQPQ